MGTYQRSRRHRSALTAPMVAPAAGLAAAVAEVGQGVALAERAADS